MIDALRERAFFQKIIEGFPKKMVKADTKQKLQGFPLTDCNITDFYVCMNPIAKLNASLAQSYQDLENETYPENGFAAACLEHQLMKHARYFLRLRVKTQNEGGIDPDYLQG